MAETPSSSTRFKEYFTTLLRDAEYDVRPWELVKGMDPVVLAENPYYVIAFQIFDIWSDLIKAAGQIELALSQIIGKQKETAKVWDAYLILVCRTELHEIEEFNQFSNLVYNTHRTRKIVRTGLGDTLTRLNEVVKPFISLTKVRSTAKGRDPLHILRSKMIESGNVEPGEIEKLIAIFKERGDLTNV